jgi:hypothetical protein
LLCSDVFTLKMATVLGAETLVSATHVAPRPLKPKSGRRSGRNDEKIADLQLGLVIGTRYKQSCRSSRREDIRGCRGTAQHTFGLGTSDVSGQHHASASLFLGCSLIGTLGGSQTRPCFGESKNILLCRDKNPRPSSLFFFSVSATTHVESWLSRQLSSILGGFGLVPSI